MSTKTQSKEKPMKIFWGSGSAPCRKAMITMHELGIWGQVDEEMLTFDKQEHKSKQVTDINPRGQLPAFNDGDAVVNESNAICLYLNQKHGSKLISGDDKTKALIYQRMFEMDNIRAFIVDPMLKYKMKTPAEKWTDVGKGSDKAIAAKAELMKWEEYMKMQHNNKCEYLASDTFTMADVWFYPMLAFFDRQGAAIGNYPELEKYCKLVADRKSVKATEAPHWKVTESKMFLKDIL